MRCYTPPVSAATLLEVCEATASVLRGLRPGPAVLATVIGRSGSTPQALGARLLLFADGTMIGTVGGGAIEAQVLEACRQSLQDGQSRRIEAHLVRDLGMCCGGAMEVLVEHVQSAERLVLIGAGHVAQAIAPLALGVGFRLAVLDDREQLLNHPAFTGAECLAYDVDELDAALGEGSASDHLVIVTRDHHRDQIALCSLLRRPHRYLGMIGSKRKVHTVIARMLRREHELGRSEPDLSRVRAPIGLALGGRTPAEIAISVIAELVALRHGGSGATMSVVKEAQAAAQERTSPPISAASGDPARH
ncbi:MAG TPA: xanthine dehydrogenase accessory protein XdhC [Nannocystis exedens]|nr:xanthine dehydrogenase accessory protein XdhC [Nannocystis exedens]